MTQLITFFTGVYSATIAEAADRTNRYRYLLFFDDGYAMYSHAKSVQLVFGPQHKVWLDIPVKYAVCRILTHCFKLH